MSAVLNEPSETYYRRSVEEVSASGLKQMLRSPAHFKHWIDNPGDDKESPALEFGKAFHMATLEPETFDRTYVVLPHDAPQKPTRAMIEAKKRSPESEARCAWWGEWDAMNAGRLMLPRGDYDRARRMADSVRAHPVAAGLLVGGDREVTFRWQDDETGLACKARADLYLAGEYLMDLKTCRDASQEGFARAVASYHYDLQAMHYIDGIRSCGDAIKWFVFLAVETEAPYVCQPYLLDANAEERGAKLRHKAITRQAECVRTGRWPGYSEDLTQITLPAWAYFNLDETA